MQPFGHGELETEQMEGQRGGGTAAWASRKTGSGSTTFNTALPTTPQAEAEMSTHSRAPAASPTCALRTLRFSRLCRPCPLPGWFHKPDKVKLKFDSGQAGAEEEEQEAGVGGGGPGESRGRIMAAATVEASVHRGLAALFTRFSEPSGWAHLRDEKTGWRGRCSRSHNKYTQTPACLR